VVDHLHGELGVAAGAGFLGVVLWFGFHAGRPVFLWELFPVCNSNFRLEQHSITGGRLAMMSLLKQQQIPFGKDNKRTTAKARRNAEILRFVLDDEQKP
jgi:hypothetical protein